MLLMCASEVGRQDDQQFAEESTRSLRSGLSIGGEWFWQSCSTNLGDVVLYFVIDDVFKSLRSVKYDCSSRADLSTL
jgi:hypothetical protein